MAAMAPSMAAAVSAIPPAALSSISTANRHSRTTLRSSSVSTLLPKSSRLVSKSRSAPQKRHVQNGRSSTVQELAEEEGTGSAAGAGGDSVVSEVALLEEEPETPGVASAGISTKRKPSPLQRGGSLSGSEALGKDPSAATLGKKSLVGSFKDPRWIKGTWDLTKFTKDGKVNWDGVIDAEVKRRRWLEENPEASSEDEPTTFESGTIPWWAWVRRFHLPEAELLNGRAAMVGYFAAYLVDSATGVGLVDQQSSFLGKLLLFITIAGILLIRKSEDVETLKTLAKESTFYDKQWQASWKQDPAKEEEKPSE